MGIVVASTLATLAVHQALGMRFLGRLVGFSLLAFVPLFINLIISVTNTHKIFAYANDYLYTFKIFSEAVPLEEVALVFIIPLFVATFYEMYLDDGSLKKEDGPI